MLTALLKFIASRIVVRTKRVPHMVDYLKADLAEKGFRNPDKITREVGLVVVEEALRQAGEMEKDGRARCGRFYKQIELAADQIIAAFRGDEDVDPRIKNILVFHKVL